MEQTVQDNLGALVTRETWSVEDHRDLLKLLSSVSDAPNKFKAILARLVEENPQPRGGAAMKIGICQYTLSRFNEALATLAEATDNQVRRYFQALCYRSLCQYAKALEELDRARSRGYEGRDLDLLEIEMRALSGDIAAAQKAIGKLEGRLDAMAEYWYTLGVVREVAGQVDAALEAYEKARQVEPNHAGATFRMAYVLDLHGDEEQAMELYKQCVARPPIYANALLNLAVLYEDQGRYDQSAVCLRRILATNPNHPRARLFLKDVDASKSMFYDEEQAKRIARRNAVLDIPVTDFELSVRARNCLKKMNIRTLGDLIRTSEQELLGYKNFGETSLKEIKDMLTAKGLRLGMGLEDSVDRPIARTGTPAPAANEGVMATPLEHVEFSVRARRALETLKLKTLGELASRSESELMACKNFGQTSLNEIRQRLAEYGVKLRESN
jgi:DNA-directed RNA polymerase subunit alpha